MRRMCHQRKHPVGWVERSETHHAASSLAELRSIIRLAKSRAQHVNVLGEKSQPALGEIDREEAAPARHEVAPVICHLILAYRNARDGFRYAQPILPMRSSVLD